MMKQMIWSAVALLGLGVAQSAEASVALACEQGPPKICEVMLFNVSEPAPYTYAWTVTTPGIWSTWGECQSDASICAVWCDDHGRGGSLAVTVYDANGGLVGSASRGLGCVRGGGH